MYGPYQRGDTSRFNICLSAGPCKLFEAPKTRWEHARSRWDALSLVRLAGPAFREQVWIYTWHQLGIQVRMSKSLDCSGDHQIRACWLLGVSRRMMKSSPALHLGKCHSGNHSNQHTRQQGHSGPVISKSMNAEYVLETGGPSGGPQS